MNTHTFILPSGVSCEIQELTGEHQEIYLTKKYIKDGTNLVKFLSSVVVCIGDKKELTENDILDLLSQDARVIMLEIKKQSLEGEAFEFEYTFEHNGKNFKHPISIDLNEVNIVPCNFQCENYKQVNELKKQKFVLPRSKEEINFQLGDLRLELEQSQKKEVSILHIIESRKPTKTKDKHEIVLDVKKMLAKDIGALATQIRNCEGFVDSIVQFQNPYNDEMTAFDFITIKDFLFQGLL
jgi:hypothetical protein